MTCLALLSVAREILEKDGDFTNKKENNMFELLSFILCVGVFVYGFALECLVCKLD